MHTHVKTKLVGALRSGKYRKAKHQLRTIDDRFCVNGVLCDLADQDGVQMRIKRFNGLDESTGVSYDGHGAFPPPAVIEWSGVGDKEYLLNKLARLNDLGKSFDEIADRVEEVF